MQLLGEQLTAYDSEAAAVCLGVTHDTGFAALVEGADSSAPLIALYQACSLAPADEHQLSRLTLRPCRGMHAYLVDSS
jgi:hypothetical protein